MAPTGRASTLSLVMTTICSMVQAGYATTEVKMLSNRGSRKHVHHLGRMCPAKDSSVHLPDISLKLLKILIFEATTHFDIRPQPATSRGLGIKEVHAESGA